MAKPALKLVTKDERGPSYRFLRLTRNPCLPSPARFEPTVKQSGDVVI
jgi:hypothetical protein